MRGPIHQAGVGSVEIAHRDEGGVRVPHIVADAERGGMWIGLAGLRLLSDHPEVWMLYCPGPGWVLHALGFVVGQSPWNRLSGERFSWMTRMMCWKAVIWAEAGVARQSAASVNGTSLFTTLPPVTNLYCA